MSDIKLRIIWCQMIELSVNREFTIVKSLKIEGHVYCRNIGMYILCYTTHIFFFFDRNQCIIILYALYKDLICISIAEVEDNGRTVDVKLFLATCRKKSCANKQQEEI